MQRAWARLLGRHNHPYADHAAMASLSLVPRTMIMRVESRGSAMAIEAGTSLFQPSALGVTPYRAARSPVVAFRQQRCYSEGGNQWTRTC